MDVPLELRYTTDHEWARLEPDGRVRIGLTDFAQQALGDVVFVSLPELGDDLAPSAELGEVESTKSVSELYAPVAGEVVEVNETLRSEPAMLNSDPYGEGWICLLQPRDALELEGLLSASAYRDLTLS